MLLHIYAGVHLHFYISGEGFFFFLIFLGLLEKLQNVCKQLIG